MSTDKSIFCLRGTNGIKFFYGPPSKEEYHAFPTEENPSRDMCFSKDGNLFAWSNIQRLNVAQGENHKLLFTTDYPRISLMQISPNGTYISTWSQYIVKENQQESCNLHIWDINTGQCVKSFIQKSSTFWCPQWSDDELLCGRSVNNEVNFYENANFDNISKKIFMQKIKHFSLSPGKAPYHVICFVPGLKGQPSFVRLFKYPNFEGSNAVIAQKSFYKAERVDFYWNKTGKDCIVLTSVDVDKSGMSYYGELNVYYVSVKGETARLKLSKDGPVYSVQWSPNSKEFCVVYGYMPAKATIFNLKCDAVFDFDPAPRNEVNYSPIGDRLSLSGFGNLQGLIEVWDLKAKKQVSKFTAADSTYMQWSYDGENILTATTSPRLRIGNGYRVWHYTGSLLSEVFCPSNEELYDIKWKPVPEELMVAKPTIYNPVPGIKSALPTASTQVYRPPGAQGKPSSFRLHEETKIEANNSGKLTKNQKRSLARKAKKGAETSDNKIEKASSVASVEPDTSQSSLYTSSPENVMTKETSIDVDSKVENSHSTKYTGDAETDKKIKNVLKKLSSINKLIKEKAAGNFLHPKQLEKINKLEELEAELAKLQLS